jgi:hypothetical protein
MDENEVTGEIEGISYMRLISVDALVFIPFITSILIVLLFYLKVPSILNKNIGLGKINNIIIIIWGGLFFLIFLNEALSLSNTVGEWSMYPGYGLWIIIIGFLCCSLAGFFEERFPTFTVLSYMEKINKEKGTEKVPESSSQKTEDKTEGIAPSPLNIDVQETTKEALVKPDPAPSAPAADIKDLPYPVGEPIESEHTEEELRNLTRWSKHIDEHNQAYEQCMKCQNYVFMKANETQGSYIFICPECNTSYKLSK